jgi:coproporphyrinogen III oxidase
MAKHYSVNAVVCSRGNTFDAEVHFTEEEWTRNDSKRETIAKVIRTGISSREIAKEVAEVVVHNVEVAIKDAAKTILRQYATAKP